MNTTIAAISTAVSASGIGIIRISGPEAMDVISRIYRSKGGKKKIKEVPTHTIHYGYIYDGEEAVDEVLVMVMRAPKTFTGEDTVEIDCHGGVYAMNRVLETVLKNGAKIAGPGEFTKRAFLNGRLDLSQAEAVMDVIQAKNEYALKSSMSQLKGSVQKTIKEIRSDLIYEIALDDPEHISLEGYPQKLHGIVEKEQKSIEELLKTSTDGKIIREGIETVIVGKPNAGKSSLLNLLVGENKAIVTDIEGTTRDILEEYITLHGITLKIVDTAGIRETEDVVEKIGVERAKKYAAEADLILYVVDASEDLDEDDQEIISLLNGKKAIILLNKSDLENKITEDILKEKLSGLKNKGNIIEDIKILRTSTIDPSADNSGMEELEETIREMFFKGELKYNNELVVTNLRHKEALQDALSSLKLVERSIEDGMPEYFYSIDLTSAYASLGKIIGEEVDEDVVNEIFSKFCMGK